MNSASLATTYLTTSSETVGPVAAVDNLAVTFTRDGRSVHAVRGVSLRIDAGEIVGLVGESGSGKSVLGLSMLGLLPAATVIEGTVRINGRDLRTTSERELRKVRRLDLGAVFQDPMTSLNPTMKIGRQVAEAAGSMEEAEKLLAAVGIPEPGRRMGSYPNELSGGLRQRVMIAIAVAGRPSLIVADEPTTALDVTVQGQVLSLLRSLRDEVGCAILLVTHDLGVAAQIADRVVVMYAGRIAEDGPTETILSLPSHPYTTGLLRSRLSLETVRGRRLAAMPGEVPSPVTPLSGCAFAPRCVVREPECEKAIPEAVFIGPAHLSACVRPPGVAAEISQPQPDSSTPDQLPTSTIAETGRTLTVKAVSKGFTVGGRRGGRSTLHALQKVSLTVAPGESVALVGESGSGKSTLLRVIAGLETPDQGTVELPQGHRPQMVFQDSGASLTPWMTVGELIEERLRNAPRNERLGRSDRRARVIEALTRVGLQPETARARASQLSGGQRQRVALARATVLPPAMLLCDEPTSALDVSLAASVINLIGDLRTTLGMSVLFVTHDLAVARIVADRIAVMYLGRIVEIGTAEEITGSPKHPYTQALIASIPDLGTTAPRLRGEPASPLSPPPGCAFHPRCPIAVSVCSDPDLELGLAGVVGSTHHVACTERR
ncbi:peptide ABC transporter ATP-binding protein [Rhodococcus sp. SRB_17]|nr:peptide ABC transporter ATP-binding protein [Rhodococcus sp. SRB_17]